LEGRRPRELLVLVVVLVLVIRSRAVEDEKVFLSLVSVLLNRPRGRRLRRVPVASERRTFRAAMLKTWSSSIRLAVEVIDAHEVKLEFTQKTSIQVERGGPGQPAGLVDRGSGEHVHGELSLAAR